MGLFSWIKGVIGKMFFKTDAKRVFDTDILLSDVMDSNIRKWNRIYTGHPDWIDRDSHIKTINFAKAVTSETARLACLDLSIKIDGSARAEYLQKVIDNMFDNIREYVEKGCANGTIVLKTEWGWSGLLYTRAFSSYRNGMQREHTWSDFLRFL